ncbi:hypothetical protein M9458_054805, partial [Cirrhinus mrigala]
MYQLPSSTEPLIKVPAELRESLSCLDIVWSNMFEDQESEPEEAREIQANFLRGAPPQWLNFHTETLPLVKRDGFNDLIELIRRKTREHRLITDVSLRYQSGSGGSTLAMQVLWHFRKDLRCARVINSDLDTKKLSKQVVDLFLLSKEEHAERDRKTVLLLLDTKEKIDNDLREDLIDEIHKRRINTDTPAVIILNCIPTDFTLTDTMILPPKLSEGEMKKIKEKLLQQIRLQRKGHWKVTTINLLHHKDSGGSALAREVLSELSEEFTCETLTEPLKTDTAENMAEEMLRVYKTHKNTVLYLLDHECDKPLRYLLKNLQSKLQRADQTDHPAFIIINAVSKSVVQAKDEVKLKMELLPDEEERFAQKKKEIEDKYKDMFQEFHAFNIMQGGFKKEDAEKLITEEMMKHVKNHMQSGSTRLLSFLALMNSYVPGSHLLKPLCEEFIGRTQRPTAEEKPSLEMIMKPFMDLIVIFSGEQKANCIRFAHPMFADACLERFNENKRMIFDIALDFLISLVKGKESSYEQICKTMLVTRFETGQGKQNFSRLIHDIIRENDTDHCIRLLEWASELFPKNAFYPQTLARVYYIEVKQDNKYEEAIKKAEKAIERAQTNSCIRDTLGQVHKNHLLNEIKKPFPDINILLVIAQSAIKAFKDEEETSENDSEDNTPFNYSGLFGFLQVCKLIHPKMCFTQEHSEFISSLKGDVKTKYDFFKWYLAFSRPSINKEDPEYIQKDVEKCYKQYCTQSKQNKEMNSSGELPKSDINVLTENQRAIENPQSETQTILDIFENIILSQPKEMCANAKDLQARLQKLWLTEMQDRSPEFYLLILLLFWTDDAQPAIANPPNLEKCIEYLRQSYKSKYQKYLRGRYLVPLFFFGEGEGLQRLIHASKLDQTDLELLTEGDEHAQVECLQRINGKVENNRVFAIRGKKQIQVTPHDRASVCKQGQVSFYLGFNIRGPVAYNIRYEES